MARTYTSINHCALSSDTLAEANDTTQALFWRLLCISDDWGRFPNNPAKAKRMMQDFNHTVEQVKEAIEHFVNHGSVSIYEVGDLSICQWNKWDEYQTMRFKNEALLPNREGEHEPSTNPLAGRKKNQSKSNHIITNHIIGNDGTLEDTKAVDKPQPKTERKKESPPSKQALEQVLRLFPEVKQDSPGHIAQAQELDKIARIDDMPLGELFLALKWATRDDFWRSNFQSCAGLRKRRSGAGDKMKWEKIMAKWETQQVVQEQPYSQFCSKCGMAHCDCFTRG